MSHTTHCCIDHGCKYAAKDCPVAVGIVKQAYLCEQCSLEAEGYYGKPERTEAEQLEHIDELWEKAQKGTIHEYHSCSDYVFKSVPFMYPNGFTVVINYWFDFWKDNNTSFGQWLQERLNSSKMSQNHPVRQKLQFLQTGQCLIYNSENYEDALSVYKTFSDPDHYYVTFWQNGKIIKGK